MFHVEHLSARAPALVPAKAEHHTLPTDGGLGLRIDCVRAQHGVISSASVPLVTFLVHACYPAWFRVIEVPMTRMRLADRGMGSGGDHENPFARSWTCAS